MVSRIELITFHVLDLLEMLEIENDAVGWLALMADGEEIAECDLQDLCLVLKIEQPVADYASLQKIVPFIGIAAGSDRHCGDCNFGCGGLDR